jgi:hypothetical protein
MSASIVKTEVRPSTSILFYSSVDASGHDAYTVAVGASPDVLSSSFEVLSADGLTMVSTITFVDRDKLLAFEQAIIVTLAAYISARTDYNTANGITRITVVA